MKNRLGVNVDHVATVRNARGELHPSPLYASLKAIKYGADSITIHLREDRRHINDNDLKIISSNKKIPVNLEMAANIKMLDTAIRNNPSYVCIVPEKRNEITTEGGLDLIKNFNKLNYIIKQLQKKNIRTSIFIDPTIRNIKISKKLNVNCIEIHTGKISNLIKRKKNYKSEFLKIKKCSILASSHGIEVHAGHGLDYKTTLVLTKIKNIKEFNIGHFIIGESIIYGLKTVIKNFKQIIK